MEIYSEFNVDEAFYVFATLAYIKDIIIGYHKIQDTITGHPKIEDITQSNHTHQKISFDEYRKRIMITTARRVGFIVEDDPSEYYTNKVKGWIDMIDEK
jgi:hypothetical protein